LNNSPWVRLAMAAGFYLLVIWGHQSLAGGTAFAVFYAFAMAAMLVYWSEQKNADVSLPEDLLFDAGEYQDFDEYSTEDWRRIFDAEQIIDGVEPDNSWDESTPACDPNTLSPLDRESLKSALTRLDSIKSELKAQYAQLGKDQTAWRSGERWRFDGL